MKNQTAAHLKSGAAFEWVLGREFALSGVCVVAACLSAGLQFTLLVGMVVGVAALGKRLFQSAGFSPASRVDLTLFNQALLLCLFLPPQGSIKGAALAATALVLFYFVCGRRTGYALQPVCLTLAAFLVFENKIDFQLERFPIVFAGIVLGIGLVIRFPKTMIEFQRMLFIFGAAMSWSVLKEINPVTALLGSVVMGELIFDPALAPLSKGGRILQQGLTLLLLTFLLMVTPWCEAFILTGLVMGFISGWIEQKSLVSKVYRDAKKN